MRRKPHSLARFRKRDPFHLKQNLSRLYHRDPMIGSSLALTHTVLSRLLRDWLVWKYADPDLAAALHKAGHGHAAGFDLPVGDPARLKHLQSEIPKRQRASTPGLAGHAPALLLAVLYFLWHQHKSALPVKKALKRSRGLRFALLGRQNLAFVHPSLHADHALSGPCFRNTEFDVGAQRV